MAKGLMINSSFTPHSDAVDSPEDVTSLRDARATLMMQAREIEILKERTAALEAQVAERRYEDVMSDARESVVSGQRVKADFLAVMSHELRTPLNAILGYEELLAHEVGGPTTPEQKVYIARIRKGAEQLMHMIDQILCMADVDAGDDDLVVERTDVDAVARDAVSYMGAAARTRGLEIRMVSQPRPIGCFTDVAKLRQILLNLLSNAVKFTTGGDIRVHVDADRDTVAVEVHDSGPGIGKADQARIFERFVQLDASASRRFGGAGIGLAVSREYARRLGGDLTVASDRGAGSIFRLWLPVRAFPYLHSNTV
jgi:signal transduction histidine kinase